MTTGSSRPGVHAHGVGDHHREHHDPRAAEVHEHHEHHARGGHPDHHDHGQGHGAHDLRALGRQALFVALALNGAFLVVEGAVGLWSGSLALLSDAVHMLSDVVGLSVAFAAASIRLRPRDGVATYGHGRFAVLGGLFNGALALGAAVVIVVEAVERLQRPPPVPGLPVLVTAALGFVVNVASAWWIARSGDRGVNTRGALVHMLGDAMGSVAAVVAGATLAVGGPAVVDAIVSIFVAAIVGASALPLLRDAAHILLERAPRGLDLQRVQAVLTANRAVCEVTGLHAWDLDDGETVASFVLSTRERDLAALAVAADALRAALLPLGIVHATIEWRPVEAPRPCCASDPKTAQRAA